MSQNSTPNRHGGKVVQRRLLAGSLAMHSWSVSRSRFRPKNVASVDDMSASLSVATFRVPVRREELWRADAVYGEWEKLKRSSIEMGVEFELLFPSSPLSPIRQDESPGMG